MSTNCPNLDGSSSNYDPDTGLFYLYTNMPNKIVCPPGTIHKKYIGQFDYGMSRRKKWVHAIQMEIWWMQYFY